MKKWDKAAALNLWEEGKTDPEIAEAVGVSAQTIKVWRKREGLKSNYDPAFARKPKVTVKEVLVEPEAETVDAPDGNGPAKTKPDGPVELHLELCGGWARLRAPSWEEAARLWRMLDVCVGALSAGGGHG